MKEQGLLAGSPQPAQLLSLYNSGPITHALKDLPWGGTSYININLETLPRHVHKPI